MEDRVPEANVIGIIAKPMTVKIAQTLGVTATAYLAGQTATATYGMLPGFMASPAPLLVWQWNKARKSVFAPSSVLATVGAAVFAWMASREPSTRTSSFRLYTLASLLLPSGFLFDLLVTGTVSRELQKRDEQYRSTGGTFAPTPSDAENASELSEPSTLKQFVTSILPGRQPSVEDLTVHQLADRWGWLNLGQASIYALGALSGAFAVIDEDLSFFELIS